MEMDMKIKLILLFLCSFVLCSLAAITVPYSKVPVFTDENMLSNFKRIDPEDYTEDKLNTKGWIWQDEEALFVHMICDKDENFSFGSISSRDNATRTDFLRVQLITIPKAYFSYYYIAYPNGSLSDGTRDANHNVDSSWNSSYSYNVDEDDNAWGVTFRIPLGELRFVQELPYEWKVILTRYNHKNKEYFSVPAFSTNERKNYFLRAQDIRLDHKVKRDLNIRVMPYYVKSYDLTNSYDPENIGLDISLSPTPRTKSKLSFNPDFSDIPMDSASDYYNSRYPVWFEEKRYFFTEDIDALGVNSEIFYTRNIAQPQFAYKLTGNAGWANYGILGALDKEIRDGDDLINRDDYYQVLAFNPEFMYLNIKNALVSRINENYQNHLYSATSKWEFRKNFFIRGVLYCSYTEEDNKNLWGSIVNTTLSYAPPEWDLSIYGSVASKNLRYDSGYYVYNDFQKLGYSFEYNMDTRDAYLKSWGASYWGDIMQQELSIDPYVEGSQGAQIYLNFMPNYSINFSGGVGEEHDLSKKFHHTYWTNSSVYKEFGESFSLNYSININKGVVYSLNDTKRSISHFLYARVTASKQLSTTISMKQTNFDYDKYYLLISETDTTEVWLDNNYQIINCSLKINPNLKSSLDAGMGISTYETRTRFANLSFYANYAYEFLPDSFFYLGYKTQRYQDEKSTQSQALGHFKISNSSMYLKVALRL